MGKRAKKQQNNVPIGKKELKRAISSVIKAAPGISFNYKEMANVLGLPGIENHKAVFKTLEEMHSDGDLEMVSMGRFRSPNRGRYITGTVDLTAKGSAYIISDDIEKDVYVSFANLKHALQGDVVKVMVYAHRNADRPEGEVVEIIERKRATMVGVIDISGNYAFLEPTGKQLPYDIFVPIEELNGAKDGDKVVVEITSWPERHKNPIGKVITVLGKPGDNDTEMHAIMAEFELPIEFPESVLKAAEKIPFEIPASEIAKRRDMRKVLTFTIDPADAKDFDDALSFRYLDNGTYEVGVHIADVSHYVQPNTVIDKEAYARATSVYLVDRTIPMLPEKLCNGVCSLRPNEEKLTFSAIFVMDKEANILDSWYGRAVINSDYRFAYEEAQAIIEGAEHEIKSEILILNDLAQKMRAARFQSGALDFDREEVKFNLDEQGKPIGVFFKRSKEANKLIEEFMLLANRSVAAFVGNKPKAKTFVYRVHEKPLDDKLRELNDFIAKFGYEIKMGNPRAMTTSFNALMQSIKDKPEENLIETLAVRSMAKAIYTTENIGHFGLAFDYYTHFTSPIRRYPDVMVHRLLDRYLENGRSASKEKYEEYCKHSSDMEQLAANAERASIKYKQVEYMSDKIGQSFAGTISGVTQWGFFVELNDSKCEGLVSIAGLDDDYYEFDEPNYRIVGRHHHKTYQLGDVVTVRVAKANLFSRQLDYELAGDGNTFTGQAKEETRVAIIGGRSTRITGKKEKTKKGSSKKSSSKKASSKKGKKGKRK